jgi:hypothetical protein
MVKVILSFLFFVLSITSLGGTIDPYIEDSKYIEYGEKFHYIGEILVTKKDKDGPYAGSVVALNDSVVLTAAHILHEHEIAKILINKKVLNVKKAIPYHEYDYEIFGKHDIAICFVDDVIGLKWYPELYSETDETDKVCSLSGFGSTGTFASGINRSGNGIKRAGSNIIDSTNNFVLFCSPSFLHKRTSLEFLIAVGDSGGGLFIDNKLAGIHSGIIEDKPNRGKSKYGAISVHTRISSYKGWIKEVLDQYRKENE